MKKIGIVTEFFFPHQGGVPEHVYFFSKELAGRGFSVVIFTGDPRQDPGIPLPPGVRLRRFGKSLPILSNGAVGKITWAWDLGKQVKLALQEEQVDLLHIHNPLYPTLPLLFLKYSQSINVGTLHAYFKNSPYLNLLKGFAQKYLNKLEGIIAVSDASKEAVQNYVKGNFRVIPNGVGNEWFSDDKKKITRFDDGGFNIFILGRLEPRMRLEAVLKAFPLIQKEIPKSRIIVAGDGPLKEYYRKKAGVHLNKGIFFVGSVTFQEKLFYMNTAQVFCYPAQNHSFGIALLEAMASGVPVVAADCPGFRVLIKNGVNGLLVDLDDSKALAREVIKIYTRNEFCQAVGREARKTALGYSWSRVADRILDFYDEIFLREKGIPFAA